MFVVYELAYFQNQTEKCSFWSSAILFDLYTQDHQNHTTDSVLYNYILFRTQKFQQKWIGSRHSIATVIVPRHIICYSRNGTNSQFYFMWNLFIWNIRGISPRDQSHSYAFNGHTSAYKLDLRKSRIRSNKRDFRLKSRKKTNTNYWRLLMKGPIYNAKAYMPIVT